MHSLFLPVEAGRASWSIMMIVGGSMCGIVTIGFLPSFHQRMVGDTLLPEDFVYFLQTLTLHMRYIGYTRCT